MMRSKPSFNSIEFEGIKNKVQHKDPISQRERQLEQQMEERMLFVIEWGLI